MPRLTQQQIDSIPELYESGLSTYKIAEKLNCSNVYIWKQLKKEQIETRKSGGAHMKGKTTLTEIQLTQLKELYEGGESSNTIANKLNYSHSTILRALRSIGIQPRGKGCYDKGKTILSILIRTHTEVRDWKKNILKRDKYTCTFCGKKGGDLDIDHIIPLSYIIKQHKIVRKNYLELIHLFLDTNNGRTLCKHCHKNTETFGHKALQFNTSK